MSFQLEIHTPSATLIKGEADSIVAPSVSGEVGILPHHAAYLTILRDGKLSVQQGANTQDFSITGGVLKVDGNHVTVLVDGLA